MEKEKVKKVGSSVTVAFWKCVNSVTVAFWKCVNFLMTLSVEPIAIFIFLGFQLWMTCFQTGLYQVICYQLYHTNTTINCQKPIHDVAVQNKIQQTLARWFMILMLAFVVPGMISSCILGAWADLVGRKTNLVLCITGLVIGVFPLTIIFMYRLTPLWILAITFFIGGCCGFLGIIFTSAMAYLTDTVLDKKELAIRMVMFSVLMSISGVFGSLLSGVLLKHVHMSWIVVIIELLFVTSIFYTLATLEQLPPSVMRKKILAKEMKASGKFDVSAFDKTASIKKDDKLTKSEKNENNCMKSFKAVPALVCQLAKDTWWTYKQPRQGKNRTFLILTVVILFLHMMADTGVKGNIMGQYVMKSPFNWTDGVKLGYWRTASSILSFFGNVTGIIILKKLLKFSDTSIMLISIVSGIGELILFGISSSVGELILFGLSSSEWMLYLAIVVGCLSNLVMPLIASFTSQLVDGGEIGKSFVAHGLASSLAFVCSTILFQNMYSATVVFYAGFCFLFGAGMMVICFFIILWIHLTIMREDKVIVVIDDRRMSEIIIAEAVATM